MKNCEEKTRKKHSIWLLLPANKRIRNNTLSSLIPRLHTNTFASPRMRGRKNRQNHVKSKRTKKKSNESKTCLIQLMNAINLIFIYFEESKSYKRIKEYLSAFARSWNRFSMVHFVHTNRFVLALKQRLCVLIIHSIWCEVKLRNKWKRLHAIR